MCIATIHAKNIRVHTWTENMGLFYQSSEGAYKMYAEKQFYPV